MRLSRLAGCAAREQVLQSRERLPQASLGKEGAT